MRATEAFKYGPVGPGTYGPFILYGGIYQVDAVGFVSGTAKLQQLGPDATTWLDVSNSITANGGDTIYLPPGQFRFVTTTDPALYVLIVRVPTGE